MVDAEKVSSPNFKRGESVLKRAPQDRGKK
jgi:hypothetical protein